uniref:Uncharacterized protein n=1 Tax=Ananas comosus var. bracteatus TaxID=296719 RepID=A0A6V7QCF2_ANACO|nr:unnamed protein product [Ananas comosus var. bracteatus]
MARFECFDLCSEFFQIFWRVVDSVPTYGLYPEICGLKLCTKTQKVGLLVCSRVAFSRLCTGTGLMAVPIRGDGVPVGGACTGTPAASQPTRGSGLAFSTPSPLVFPGLASSGEEGLIPSFALFLLFGDFSTMGEAWELGVELVREVIFNPSRYTRVRRGSARRGRSSADSALPQRPELAVPRLYSLGYREAYGVGRDRLIPRVGMLELPPALRRHKLNYTCVGPK